MCIGIIRNNFLVDGRARAESNPGHWARHALLHMAATFGGTFLKKTFKVYFKIKQERARNIKNDTNVRGGNCWRTISRPCICPPLSLLFICCRYMVNTHYQKLITIYNSKSSFSNRDKKVGLIIPIHIRTYTQYFVKTGQVLCEIIGLQLER